MIMPKSAGASKVACDIVNETFLSLDGFAALRKEMDDSEYDSHAFAAEQARIIDRVLNDAYKKAFEKFAESQGFDKKTLFASNEELAS